ncbi:NUDIX hydrolase domain-like protein, partial [Powellomyces hirtus]
RYKGPENTTWRHAGVCIPLVNLAKDGGEPSVLLTVRSSTLRRNGGEVAFPGGSQDPGDRTIVDTALRETEEEVGIPADSVDVLGVFHPLPDRSHTILIHPVLCHVPSLQSLSDLACNPEEVSEAFTVPLAQLLCMGTHVERLRGGPRNVRNWHVDGRKIWGLSAWILEGVLKEVI